MRTPFAAKTSRDMVISIAVIMLPIALVTWFFSTPAQTPVAEVEWQPVHQRAAAEAGYPALKPALGDGWRVTKAQFDPGARRWELGALSPEKIYFSVLQVPGAARDEIAKACRKGDPADAVQIDSRAWEQCVSADGRTRVLASRDRVPGATTIVAADADLAALQGWAASLR